MPVKTETKKDKDGKTVEPTEKETKAAEKKAKEGAAALEAAMKAGDTKKVAPTTATAPIPPSAAAASANG